LGPRVLVVSLSSDSPSAKRSSTYYHLLDNETQVASGIADLQYSVFCIGLHCQARGTRLTSRAQVGTCTDAHEIGTNSRLRTGKISDLIRVRRFLLREFASSAHVRPNQIFFNPLTLIVVEQKNSRRYSSCVAVCSIDFAVWIKS
jgi:hypothetical protein